MSAKKGGTRTQAVIEALRCERDAWMIRAENQTKRLERTEIKLMAALGLTAGSLLGILSMAVWVLAR